eukprot:4202311-Pyramimonas_sp.AAC.1
MPCSRTPSPVPNSSRSVTAPSSRYHLRICRWVPRRNRRGRACTCRSRTADRARPATGFQAVGVDDL